MTRKTSVPIVITAILVSTIVVSALWLLVSVEVAWLMKKQPVASIPSITRQFFALHQFGWSVPVVATLVGGFILARSESSTVFVSWYAALTILFTCIWTAFGATALHMLYVFLQRYSA